MLKKFVGLFFLTTCCLLNTSPCTAETKTITMSVYITPDESPRCKFLQLIYKEAFRRLGYNFELHIAPQLRGSMRPTEAFWTANPFENQPITLDIQILYVLKNR